MATTASAFTPQTLPLVGHSRWAQLKPFLPVCRATWQTMCREGRAPRPIRLTERCTVWNNVEIHRWLSDPKNYRAESVAA